MVGTPILGSWNSHLFIFLLHWYSPIMFCISGKIPSFEMDDDYRGTPMTQETPDAPRATGRTARRAGVNGRCGHFCQEEIQEPDHPRGAVRKRSCSFKGSRCFRRKSMVSVENPINIPLMTINIHIFRNLKFYFSSFNGLVGKFWNRKTPMVSMGKYRNVFRLRFSRKKTNPSNMV